MSKWIESVARGTHYARAASAPQSGGRKEGRTDGRSLGRSFHAKPTDFQLSSPTATEASSRHPLTVQQQQLAPPPPTDALAVHPGILASSPRMRERSYSVPTISVFSQQLRCITAIRATILYTGLGDASALNFMNVATTYIFGLLQLLRLAVIFALDLTLTDGRSIGLYRAPKHDSDMTQPLALPALLA